MRKISGKCRLGAFFRTPGQSSQGHEQQGRTKELSQTGRDLGGATTKSTWGSLGGVVDQRDLGFSG